MIRIQRKEIEVKMLERRAKSNSNQGNRKREKGGKGGRTFYDAQGEKRENRTD